MRTLRPFFPRSARSGSLAAQGVLRPVAGVNHRRLLLSVAAVMLALFAHVADAQDTEPPTVTSVSGANGAYKRGTGIYISVTFSEPVTISGGATLTLNSGGSASHLNVSGGQATQIFYYEVGIGHNSLDLDYTSTFALTVSNGAFMDSSGNNAILTLPSPGAPGSLAANSDVVVDTIVPTAILTPNGTRVRDSPIIFTATLSEPVAFTNDNIFVRNNGVAGDVTGSGTIYTFPVTPSSQGTVTCEIFGLTDAAGNFGSFTFSSVTFDNVPPALPSVSIYAGNSGSTRAKDGDVVAIAFTSTEVIATPNVTIASRTAAISGSGTSWTASITVDANDAAGPVPFQIAFQDLAGNLGTVVATTTDGSAVSIRTPPTLTSVTIASTNSNSLFARAEDTIILMFTGSEGLSTPTVTIAGQNAEVGLVSGNTWSASTVVSSSSPEGATAFNIQFSTLGGDAGSPVTATTNSSKVTIDTTPPALSLEARRVSANETGFAALPNLSAIASDLNGVSTFEQSPASGVILALGAHQVSVSATDPIGNEASGELTLTVAFERVAPPAKITVRGYTGQPAPGAGQAGGPPAGAVLASFSTPALSDHRDLASLITMKSGAIRLGGIYAEDGAGSARLIAFQRMPAPGLPAGIAFKTFRDPVIAPAGAVAFSATISGSGVTPSNDDGVWTDAFGGGLKQVLREGEYVPSLPANARLKSVTSISLRNGELLALVRLLPSRGVVVTGHNDVALVRITAPGQAELLLRTAEFLGASQIATMSVLQPAAGSPGQGRWYADDAVIAKVTLKDRSSALVSLPPGGPASSLLDSGVTFSSLGLPSIDRSGTRVAALGTYVLTPGVVTSASDTVLLLSDAGGSFNPFAREGGPAPVNPPSTDVKYASFFPPIVNDDGTVLFQATLQGPGITAANKSGLWWGAPGSPVLIARLSGTAPGTDGLPLSQQLWSSFTSYALPNGEDANPVFVARLSGRSPMVTPKNNLGVWAVDSTGILRLLLRTGSALQLGAASKTIASLRLLNSLPGSFGAARSYNQSGSISALAVFTDNSQALVRIDIP